MKFHSILASPEPPGRLGATSLAFKIQFLFDERSHIVPKRASGGLWKRFWRDFGRICRGIWEDFGDRGVHFGRTWKGFGDLWIHLERNMVSAIFLLKSAAPYKWTSAKLEFAVRFTMHWNPTLWNRRFDHYCAAPSRRHSKKCYLCAVKFKVHFPQSLTTAFKQILGATSFATLALEFRNSRSLLLFLFLFSMSSLRVGGIGRTPTPPPPQRGVHGVLDTSEFL